MGFIMVAITDHQAQHYQLNANIPSHQHSAEKFFLDAPTDTPGLKAHHAGSADDSLCCERQCLVTREAGSDCAVSHCLQHHENIGWA